MISEADRKFAEGDGKVWTFLHHFAPWFLVLSVIIGSGFGFWKPNYGNNTELATPETALVNSPAPRSATITGITITTYHPGPKEGVGDGCTTADGTKICGEDFPRGEFYCGVSRDLLKIAPFGSIVKLRTLGGFWSGSCIIHDTTHERFTKRVDIMIPPGMKGHVYPNSELHIMETWAKKDE